MLVFHFGKSAAVSVLVRPSSAFLFARATKQSDYLTFRTTKVKDTKLTLAIISFKAEANNSLIFLPLQTYDKKFAEVPFLLVYNSLVSQTVIEGVVFS